MTRQLYDKVANQPGFLIYRKMIDLPQTPAIK